MITEIICTERRTYNDETYAEQPFVPFFLLCSYAVRNRYLRSALKICRLRQAPIFPYMHTMPFALPLREARLTSPFGYRYHPISGQLDFHYGLDLAAPEKTPIYAAVAGVVQIADTHESYGNYILNRPL